MPVIIPEQDYDRWLDPAAPSPPPIDLLRPYDAELMKAWKVDNAVGHVYNDFQALISPVAEGADTAQVKVQPGLF
jgi:putative SOS response-associated peptidase YedK